MASIARRWCGLKLAVKLSYGLNSYQAFDSLPLRQTPRHGPRGTLGGGHMHDPVIGSGHFGRAWGAGVSSAREKAEEFPLGR
jgi:hypothetical protein